MTPPEPLTPGDYDLPPSFKARLAAYADHPTHPVRFDRTETPEEREARQAAATETTRARWAIRLPVMYRDATVAQVVTDQDHLDPRYLESVQAFWKQEGPLNLVLAGPLGTGKTHAAYALGNDAVNRGRWAEAWTVTDLLAALRPDGDPSVLRDVRRCALLILDDLGATKASEWAVEQMTSVMDARIRENRQTILTTNVPEPELEAAWGGRFMDRVRYRRAVAVFHGASRRGAAW